MADGQVVLLEGEETGTGKRGRKVGGPEERAQRRRRKQRRLVMRLAVLVVMAAVFFNPVRSLLTLEKVDDYPIYVMTWYGGHRVLDFLDGYYSSLIMKETLEKQGLKACSMAAALGDGERPMFARNFDWTYSPVLILHSDPPGGYASVSVVDIFYLGFFDEERAREPAWWMNFRFWLAPVLPFEGMNEKGLVISIAAVPNLEPLPKAGRKSTTGLGIMRKVLDGAATTEEAIALFEDYNIAFPKGPNIHYLVADRQGRSAIIEVMEDELVVLRNREPWQGATNHYIPPDEPERACRRLRKAQGILRAKGGKMGREEMMDLLDAIDVGCTVWSIVYDMAALEMDFALEQDYEHPHVFGIRQGR